MADIVKKEVNANVNGGIMFFGLRFLIFFGLSFFMLSLPYKQRPIFYYLHQGTSKVILTLTGTNYYQPTFTIQSDSLDKAKSQLAAPVKNKFNEAKAQFVDEIEP
jgi:hypothetical protein